MEVLAAQGQSQQLLLDHAMCTYSLHCYVAVSDFLTALSVSNLPVDVNPGCSCTHIFISIQLLII